MSHRSARRDIARKKRRRRRNELWEWKREATKRYPVTDCPTCGGRGWYASADDDPRDRCCDCEAPGDFIVSQPQSARFIAWAERAGQEAHDALEMAFLMNVANLWNPGNRVPTQDAESALPSDHETPSNPSPSGSTDEGA